MRAPPEVGRPRAGTGLRRRGRCVAVRRRGHGPQAPSKHRAGAGTACSAGISSHRARPQSRSGTFRPISGLEWTPAQCAGPPPQRALACVGAASMASAQHAGCLRGTPAAGTGHGLRGGSGDTQARSRLGRRFREPRPVREHGRLAADYAAPGHFPRKASGRRVRHSGRRRIRGMGGLLRTVLRRCRSTNRGRTGYVVRRRYCNAGRNGLRRAMRQRSCNARGRRRPGPGAQPLAKQRRVSRDARREAVAVQDRGPHLLVGIRHPRHRRRPRVVGTGYAFLAPLDVP